MISGDNGMGYPLITKGKPELLIRLDKNDDTSDQIKGESVKS